MFNRYCFTSLLICRSNIGDHLQIQSKKGLIQGCHLLMFLYGIGVLLLIQKLKELNTDVIRPWFANDVTGTGGWQQLG